MKSVYSALLMCGLVVSASAHAQQKPDQGKLLATGGITSVEGSGGGGITPWALITGYGSDASYGGNVSATTVRTQDYGLTVLGASVGIADRVELSVAKQTFTGSKAPLDSLRIEQDIFGAKVRVAGDAVYHQDSWMPQVAVGFQYKENKGIQGLEGLGVFNATDLGAKKNSGIDYYVAATKIFLDKSVLVNGTVRFTKANQMGLLGFGGPDGDKYEPMLEGSIAYLVNKNVAVGAEYRMKPRNLSGIDKEKAYSDLFVAYFPTKNVSVTAAYASLGDITVFNNKRQNGYYLSVQAGF